MSVKRSTGSSSNSNGNHGRHSGRTNPDDSSGHVAHHGTGRCLIGRSRLAGLFVLIIYAPLLSLFASMATVLDQHIQQEQQQQQQQFVVSSQSIRGYNPNGMERELAEVASTTTTTDTTIENQPQYRYDVAVVGAGPAGLTAALFAVRAGLSALVLGSQSGLLSETPSLDNFPSWWGHQYNSNNNLNGGSDNSDGSGSSGGGGSQWLQQTRQQAQALGVQFAPPGLWVTRLQPRKLRASPPSSPFWELQTARNDYSLWARSVIVATGATPRRLHLPYEDDYLWGRSVHNCPICDGPLYAPATGDDLPIRQSAVAMGYDLLVVGGGEAALDAALYLAQLWVHNRVVLVHRRPEFRTAPNSVLLKLVQTTSNIVIKTPYVVKEWQVEQNPNTTTVTTATAAAPRLRLVGARLERQRVSITGNGQGLAKRDGNDDTVVVPCQGAFLMIGAIPNTQWLANSLDLDEQTGLIRLHNSDTDDEPGSTTRTTTGTSVPGVFAAGEVTDSLYKQAITAAAAGAQASLDAERWLRLHPTPWNTTAATRLIQTTKTQPPVPEPQSDVTEKCDLTTKECILRIVGTYPVVVFFKSWCPHCKRAMEAFSLAGFNDPHVIDLTTRAHASQIQATLEQMTGRRTVPNVFVRGHSIGGGEETVQLQRKGQLQPLLEKARASAIRAREEKIHSVGQKSPGAMSRLKAWVAEQNQRSIINEQTMGQSLQQQPRSLEGNGKHMELGEGDNCDLTKQECILRIVAKYPVVVFSKPWCPHCKDAMEALSLAGLKDPRVIDLTTRDNASDIQATLEQMTGRRTVPNVFVGGQSIGGGDESVNLQRMGQLQQLLEKARAHAVPSSEGKMLLVDKQSGSLQQQASLERDEKHTDVSEGDNCDLTTQECILRIVGKYPVVVFSKSWCGHCKDAMEALSLAGLKDPHVIDLTNSDGRVQATLEQMTGRRTVPNVFVGGRSIGGGDETVALQRMGQLLPLVDRARETYNLAAKTDVQNHNSEKTSVDNCDLSLDECMTSIVQKYPLVVFSSSTCPECLNILELLRSMVRVRNHTLHIVELGPPAQIAPGIRDQLRRHAQSPSVPSLFIGGQSIGGYDAASGMFNSGSLVPLLQKAGVELDDKVIQ